MISSKFDPFNDRLSRDIRNDLSKAFAEALAKRTMAPAEAVAAGYRASGIAQGYEAYISDRLLRYRESFRTISDHNTKDAFTQALVLWDIGLFFEVHEILEHAWLKAQGAKKTILQAMIRAAGFYIKNEYGYKESAAKMAARAVDALEKNRQAVPAGFDLDLLLSKLKTLDPIPPKLSSPSRN